MQGWEQLIWNKQTRVRKLEEGKEAEQEKGKEEENLLKQIRGENLKENKEKWQLLE